MARPDPAVRASSWSHMGLFSRALGVIRGSVASTTAARARRKEALGDLAEATALYVEAELPAEAARLYAVRARSALEPEQRLGLLAQAIALASEDQARELTLERCRLALDLVRSDALHLTRGELSDLGRQLEHCGEPELAAEAFALGGDLEAQARTLVAAGEVERLESILEAQQERRRAERRRDDLYQKARDLEVAGRRREALRIAKSEGHDDERLARLAREIETRRVSGPRAELEIDGERLEVAFGDAVIIGRAEATVVVPAPCVSRSHLSVRRTSRGLEAMDLGSSNGTLLAGARIDVPVEVGPRLALELGGEVALALSPWRDGVRIEVAGRVVHAPLGPLVVGSWSIEPGADDWLELSAGPGEPARLGALRADRIVQLCRGDELSAVEGSARLLVIS